MAVSELHRRSGDPLRLCQEGKRKLTESAKEFPKGSAWQSPEGSLREVWKRTAMPRRLGSVGQRVQRQLDPGMADVPRLVQMDLRDAVVVQPERLAKGVLGDL